MTEGVRELARALGFTEGPLWLDDGRLLVASVSRGLIYEIGEEGGRELVETGGNPTGLCIDAAGDIWVAQGGGHTRTSSKRPTAACIQRLRDGAVEDLAAGKPVAPNDLTIGPDGLIWFTDPVGEAMTPTGAPGRLWTLDRESGEARVRAEGLRFPNGLAFEPETADLLLAETGTARILRFVADGDDLVPAGVHCELERGHPDGIAFDRARSLYVAAPDAGAVYVFDRDGRPSHTVGLGERTWPTNVCFGGEGRRSLFVTVAGGGRVIALPAEEAGAPLPA